MLEFLMLLEGTAYKRKGNTGQGVVLPLSVSCSGHPGLPLECSSGSGLSAKHQWEHRQTGAIGHFFLSQGVYKLRKKNGLGFEGGVGMVFLASSNILS